MEKSEKINCGLRLFSAYQNAPYLSVKHNSYFQVYERIFERFVGKEITFVEIGVANGGSLFMWREYFGHKAKIIGIDQNPSVKRWEQDGFEIHIGDQSKKEFWEELRLKVGKIDVLLDDGGHTNAQQISTVAFAISTDLVKDGGVIVVEDVHTSYMKSFGNPSKYSFISFCKLLIDSVNGRSTQCVSRMKGYSETIFSIECYESIVALNVDSGRCFRSFPIPNNGKTCNVENYAWEGTLRGRVEQWEQRIGQRFPSIRRLCRWPLRALFFVIEKFKNRRLSRFFRE